MLDTLGRRIDYLRLSVVDRCNCRCVYCMPPEGVDLARHDQILSFEEMAAIVRTAAETGVTKVRITGGEPLVRRDIANLVRMVRQTPGIQEVCMTTNATLLAPMAAELKEAGLDRVNISLDTLDPDRYRQITRCGRLEDALEGLEAAMAVGLTPVKVNCVLMGGVNDQDIRPLAELARDRDISVRFIELMPIGEAASWPAERFVPVERVLEVLPELEPLPRRPGDGVADRYRAPGWKGGVGLIHPVSHKFCSQCNRIRVTADGHLKPCLHSSEELPLRGLDEDALRKVVAAGIHAKPQQHRLDTGHVSDSLRGMAAIGG